MQTISANISTNFNAPIVNLGEQAHLALANHDHLALQALLVGYLSLYHLSGNDECDSKEQGDQRWITLILPKCVDLKGVKPLLSQHKRLRIIRANEEDILWITWQCLAQGNSQAVFSFIQPLDMTQNQHLNQAAEYGAASFHPINHPNWH